MDTVCFFSNVMLLHFLKCCISDPLKVAYSIIIEGCIDILFSFILYYSVKYVSTVTTHFYYT